MEGRGGQYGVAARTTSTVPARLHGFYFPERRFGVLSRQMFGVGKHRVIHPERAVKRRSSLFSSGRILL